MKQYGWYEIIHGRAGKFGGKGIQLEILREGGWFEQKNLKSKKKSPSDKFGLRFSAGCVKIIPNNCKFYFTMCVTYFYCTMCIQPSYIKHTLDYWFSDRILLCTSSNEHRSNGHFSYLSLHNAEWFNPFKWNRFISSGFLCVCVWNWFGLLTYYHNVIDSKFIINLFECGKSIREKSIKLK